jgi:hypothetical protein
MEAKRTSVWLQWETPLRRLTHHHCESATVPSYGISDLAIR